MKPIPVADEEFWSRVDKAGDCWIWVGPLRGGDTGYGGWRGNGAHRVALAATTPVPSHQALTKDGRPTTWDALHQCDTPSCVRPDHLYWGTDADNARDRAARSLRVKGLSSNENWAIRDRVLDAQQQERSGARERLGWTPVSRHTPTRPSHIKKRTR